jgi:hypothetical protein
MAGRRQVACVQQHGPANAKVAAPDVARGGIEPPTRGFSVRIEKRDKALIGEEFVSESCEIF